MKFFVRAIWVLLVFFGVISVVHAAAPRHQRGDDLRWADPGWDDRDWTIGSALPSRDGVYWIRYRIRLPLVNAGDSAIGMYGDEPYRVEGPINAVFLASAFTFELYWDGRRIAGSGVVGVDRASEKPAKLDHVIRVPDELLEPGEHVMAIRLSSFYYNFPAKEMVPGFGLRNYTEHLVWEARRPFFPLVAMGGALLVAVISGVLFALGDRWRPLWLCAALSFTLAAFYFLIAWRWLHNDPYPWLAPRLMAIAGLMTIMGVLLPWLLLEQFEVPRRRRSFAVLLPLLAAAWMISPVYEVVTLWLCRAMLTVSLGILIWAIRRQRPGAWWLSVCVVVGLLFVRTNRRDFLDPSFFLIFGMLVVSLFITLALHVRADRQRAQQASLTAARLEIELLKKNIQPHFLMNTLTTIMEVIEQEPKSAVALIEALAEEFHILARVSAKKLIPLGQELELCRAHIRIMSLRRGVACALETDGLDENVGVPPALFHTLIEGGLTHQRPRNGALKFALSGANASGPTCYTLIVHGENPPQTGSPPKDGTGLRYVKARLEESFSGRWSLDAGPVPEGWRTVIAISAPRGKAAI